MLRSEEFDALHAFPESFVQKSSSKSTEDDFWANQPKLNEAGSYGYLIKVPISNDELISSIKEGYLTIRIQTEGEGGIAIYGKSFGRYPINPSLIIKK